MLNRSALILRPKAPLLQWLRAIDPQGAGEDSADEGEQTVYLIPEVDDDQALERILTKLWREIFVMELEGWSLDESTWPQRRTLAMFKEWFRIECHSVVEDLGTGPVRDEG